jgi:hypothetical protein
MSAKLQALDPAEFVQSYTADKYKMEIGAWDNATTPGDLLYALKSLKAPCAAYVEMGIIISEEALSQFEGVYPNDPRPRQAVDAAKAWLKNRTAANEGALNKATDNAYAAYNAKLQAASITSETSRACKGKEVQFRAAQAAAQAASAAQAACSASCHICDADAEIDCASCAASATAGVANDVAHYAVRAGRPVKDVMDIIKEVGHRYYTFLKQS